jgi:hypothetical protein
VRACHQHLADEEREYKKLEKRADQLERDSESLENQNNRMRRGVEEVQDDTESNEHLPA